MSLLVRQLKLYGLVGSKVSADPRVGLIHAFFEDLFDGLQCCIIPEYNPENVIFHKGVKFYMEQDFDNGWLLCRFDGFWSYFLNELNLDREEIQAVVRYMVEKYIKQQGGLPLFAPDPYCNEVEKYINQQGGSPLGNEDQVSFQVAKYLKKQAGIPGIRSGEFLAKAERYLKQLETL